MIIVMMSLFSADEKKKRINNLENSNIFSCTDR